MIDITKRIFITGATGFIGASLLHRLVSMGANDVHILLRENSNTSRIENILKNIQIHYFSLENKDDCITNIKLIHPQIIYHIAAAGTAVGRMAYNIDELMLSNTISSMHLMDAAMEVNCEYFINTGSSSEYGKKNTPMLETDFIEPNNYYAISKASATMYATFLRRNKNFPIVTYRLFSVYGPLEDPTKLISTLIYSYLQKNIPVLTSPNFVRDFIYIDDVIDSFLQVDNITLSTDDIINIGTGFQSSIKDLVDIIKEKTGSQLDPDYDYAKINQIEPIMWVSDNSKMKKLLGIHPRLLSDGVNSMLDYFNKKYI